MINKYLKYAGSKARIISDITELIMDCGTDHKTDGVLHKFVEPFFGSGVVGLNVSSNAYIFNDSNKDLIDCHMAVIQNPDRVIELCEEFWSVGYDGYFGVRSRFREKRRSDSKFVRAAMFIYMNRFGFNGMVRYNGSGQFNVPVGKQSGKTGPQIPKDEIYTFSDAIKLSSLSNFDFESVMRSNAPWENSTIYCDSPYINVDSSGEIKYNGEGFHIEDQRRLARCAEMCRQNGSRVLISNHDLPITRDMYKNASRIVEIDAFRSISSKGTTRGKAKEIVAIYE